MLIQDSPTNALFYMSRWYCFDNFSAFTIEWHGRVYPTVEHAYQSAKFLDRDHNPLDDTLALEFTSDVIRNARSAHEAKKLGNLSAWQSDVRKDWNDVKLGIMEDLLRTKHAQHEYVRRKLADSRGLMLIEDSAKDAFWGRGPNWNGQNHLGRLWMKIRDETS